MDFLPFFFAVAAFFLVDAFFLGDFFAATFFFAAFFLVVFFFALLPLKTPSQFSEYVFVVPLCRTVTFSSFVQDACQTRSPTLRQLALLFVT